MQQQTLHQLQTANPTRAAKSDNNFQFQTKFPIKRADRACFCPDFCEIHQIKFAKMGSNNFRNFVPEPAPSSTNRPLGNFPLDRQSSVYSLTFDEFQNTLGGVGKDFGSMNMDELLKSIWSAEENQTIASTSGNGSQLDRNGGPGGYLQRQSSLTLPRTLSQKTVDEVWRGISKEFSIGKDGIVGTAGGSSVQQNQTQRQHTLGEMTLEEFLVRAGVVREDMQFPVQPNSDGLFGELSRVGDNTGLGVGFQQTNRTSDLMGMRNMESVTPFPIQSPSNLSLNINGINGVRSNPPLQGFQQQQQQLNQPQQGYQQQQIHPKQVPSAAAGGLMGVANQVISNNMPQGGAFQVVEMGMVGLGGGPVSASMGSPSNPDSSDEISRSNGYTSSLSPVPYTFNGGMRGRKAGGPLEKVVERRHRRMIKNRESAARSRARKQAYTMELEAEVAKLKEENEELRKKHAEIMEMQQNEVADMMNLQGGGGKRRCLRRTQTGPW